MSSVQTHNKTVLRYLEEGDIIKFDRGLYSHYGVYVGNEEVIHLAGEDEYDGLSNVSAEHLFTISGRVFNKAFVKRDKFHIVAGDSKAYKANKDDNGKRKPLQKHVIVQNAISKLGYVGYNIITKNCEHFANWCRYHVEKSDQVDSVMTGVVLGIAAAGTLAVASYFMGDKNKEKKQRQ